MNEKTILLSVSMLISGRNDMEKSLKSLMFFKNAFPCEIILVDTGCNITQRAIAEKYADKIINFTWCNDFALARNTGLQEAHGEWFMYLDDDEWFDNPQEIIAFFKSGEYKKFNSASYVVRNYLDPEGKTWVCSYPSRMVRIQKEIKFVGKIHEYLKPFPRPLKKFNDFVHHYGYVYRNTQDKMKHAQRNIEPLVEMQRECPGDPRWTFQLAQEYFSLEQYTKVVNVCINGIEEWEQYKNKISYCPIHVGTLFSYILICLEYLGKYEEEKNWLNKALSHPIIKMETMEVCLTFYHMMGARLYSRLKEKEQGYFFFEKYIEAAKLLRNDRNVLEIETAGIVTNVFHNLFMSETVLLCCANVITKGNYRLADEAFDMVDWNEEIISFWPEWIEDILKACCDKSYNPLFSKIFQTFIITDKSAPQTYNVLKEMEGIYRKQDEKEKVKRLWQITDHLHSNHIYIVSNRIKLQKVLLENAEMLDKENRMRELYNQMFEKCSEQIFDTEDEIWDIAEEYEINIEPLLLKIDFKIWRRTLIRIFSTMSFADWKKWRDRIESWKTKEDIRYAFFEVQYDEKCLSMYDNQTFLRDELEEKFKNFTEHTLNFYRPYYKSDVWQKIDIGLPDELQLALHLQKLQESRKQGNRAIILECLKQCLGIYPCIEKAVIAYVQSCRDKMLQEEKEAIQAKKELVEMVKSLKTVARIKLEQGDSETAKQILQEIQRVMPEDGETLSMLDLL